MAVRANPRPYYLAALEALDHELGRLLAALDTKTRANTVIIFIGDNGTPSRVVQPPYSRQTAKGSLYPGGIHVPMVIAGKGVERRGERESALVDTTDLFATIANLAGVARAPGSDSVSFVSLLAGTRSSGRNFAYADLDADQPKMMARNSGWTVRDATHQFVSLKSGKRLLFDLSADPGGEDDLLKHGNAVALDTAGRLETLGRTLRESR
ncbi:MAG: sulfatase-like hydrolase/transferase [Alphaproteobacteria bacterium]